MGPLAILGIWKKRQADRVAVPVPPLLLGLSQWQKRSSGKTKFLRFTFPSYRRTFASLSAASMGAINMRESRLVTSKQPRILPPDIDRVHYPDHNPDASEQKRGAMQACKQPNNECGPNPWNHQVTTHIPALTPLLVKEVVGND